uniref:RING-type domain-containing protein n=1 Tax=Sparus aurata TaxID=8175 RepID=A0A671TYJ1_SPAAU
VRSTLSTETFSCSICLDLLKDPVAIPCGHSYCMNCIKSFWDEKDEKKTNSCPQCRQSFTPRPKHKLVEPSEKLQENICSRHDEVMKIFCRTDQQFICYLCSMDEHKGHDTVSAAAERAERQRELEVTVEDSEKMFSELIRLIQKRSSDVKQQVRLQQKTKVTDVRELQEKLEQEITELKRRDAELEKLSHTEDHNQFLHNYPSLSQLSEATHLSSIEMSPLRHFEDVTAAVSEVRDKLQDVLSEKWANILETVTKVEVLLSKQEPKTRNSGQTK